MRLLNIKKLIPLTLGLAASGFVYAQGWIKYVNEADQFIVNFPSEPKIVETDYITESGISILSRIYSVENENSRYAITVVDYTVAEQAHVTRCRRLEAETVTVSPNQCKGTGHLTDIKGSIAFEAWNIRQRKSGEITYDAYGHVDGVPGHQIQILHSNESRSFIGLYMHQRRLYVLEGTVPGDYPPPGLFQQSLGMLDGMGRRVRYESAEAQCLRTRNECEASPLPQQDLSRIQTSYEYVGEEDPVTGEPVLDSFPSNDDRIRNPGERTGIWTPEPSDNL
jgi:hypothetical protein